MKTKRYNYNAFGKLAIYDASGTARISSSYAWIRTFTGQVYDPETGIMLYRNRYYHPTMGRFVTRDPIGYEGNEANVYQYLQNSVLLGTDPKGNQRELPELGPGGKICKSPRQQCLDEVGTKESQCIANIATTGLLEIAACAATCGVWSWLGGPISFGTCMSGCSAIFTLKAAYDALRCKAQAAEGRTHCEGLSDTVSPS